MTKDHQRLWEHVTNTTNESEAVRALAGILADREGRAFISRLERDEAELCIDILDHVSRDPCLPLPFAFSDGDGFARVSQSTTLSPPRNRFSLLR
jgi:hypothetical protein